MEPSLFTFTPAQKGLLETLSRERGVSVSALINEALTGLRGGEANGHVNGEANGIRVCPPTYAPSSLSKSLGERIVEAFSSLPKEAWDSLPADGAEHVDHYVYGLPKQ